jgi:redox-sensing transcriptional repressor
MKTTDIPDIVIGRLPIYLRSLHRMYQEGRQITSSQELSERLGISAAQIRKDLSQFGEFGKQGTGYNIEFLSSQLETILKLDRIWDVAVVIQDSTGMQKAIREAGVVVAMITVPAKAAQEVANELVEAGIKAILNYAPVNLTVPPTVRVQHIDPAVHLQRMAFYLE